MPEDPAFPRATRNPHLHRESAKHLCKFIAADLLPCIDTEKLSAHQFVFGPSVFLAKLPEQCRCAGRMEVCLFVLVRHDVPESSISRLSLRGIGDDEPQHPDERSRGEEAGADALLSTFVTCLLRFLSFLASCSFSAMGNFSSHLSVRGS